MHGWNKVMNRLPAPLREIVVRRLGSSFHRRLAQATAWSVASTLATQAFNLLTTIYLARTLGKESFGELAILTSTVSMFGAFAGMGIGLTANRYTAELRVRDPARAGRIIGLTTVVAISSAMVFGLAMVLLSGPISARVLNRPELADGVRIAAVLLACNTIFFSQQGVLAGFEAFDKLGIANVFGGIATLLGGVFGAALSGVPGAIAGYAAGNLVSSVVAGWYVRKLCRAAGIPVRYRGFAREARVLWSFSLPSFLQNVVTGPSDWVVRVFLVNHPGGYSQLALLSAAGQWQSLVRLLPQNLSSAFLPVFANMTGGSRATSSKRFVKVGMAASLALALPPAVGLAICSVWVMRLYGTGFGAASVVLVILVSCEVISAPNRIISRSILASEKTWAVFWINAGRLCLIVPIAYLLASYGAVGIALAILGVTVIHTLVLWFYLQFRILPTNEGREAGASAASQPTVGPTSVPASEVSRSRVEAVSLDTAV